MNRLLIAARLRDVVSRCASLWQATVGRLSIRLRRTVVATLLLAGAAVASFSSLALFTDAETVGANTFSTGTIDLTTSPTTAAISFSTMAPGDQVTAGLTVNNAGSLPLRYALTSTTTEDTLAAQLDLTIKVGVTTCSNAGFGVDGTVLYGAADLGSTTGIDVLGDPTQGADAGDRTVAAAASEVLCVNVTLPLSTANSFQGLNTTASLAFAAEQTTNNP